MSCELELNQSEFELIVSELKYLLNKANLRSYENIKSILGEAQI